MVEQVNKLLDTAEEEKKQQTADNTVNMELVKSLHQATFNIPKIELHAHIGGCMRPNTFMELCLAKNLDLDAVDFYNVNISSAFEFFKISAQMVTDLETLQRVTYEIIEDFEKQNTRYLELRSSPKVYGDKTKEDCLRATLEVMEAAEADMPNIKVRLLVSINRQRSLEECQDTLALVKRVQSPHIVGIELSGDPRQGEFATFEAEMQAFKQETGMKVSLHCAEVEEQMGESQAMIDFNADRLGHCIYLTPEEIQQVVDKKIPVEVCPTSNMAAYPLAYGTTKNLPQLIALHEANHNFIICTDDTMLFSTSLSMELFEYAHGFNITVQNLKDQLVRNVDAIFDDSCKEWLRNQIQSYRI